MAAVGVRNDRGRLVACRSSEAVGVECHEATPPSRRRVPAMGGVRVHAQFGPTSGVQPQPDRFEVSALDLPCGVREGCSVGCS